jgi:multicomponent Na+:H+ antiporter subunit F
VNAFTVAATVLLGGFVPCGIVILRGRPIDGVVALQLCGTLTVLALICLAEGFHRTAYLDVPVVAAVLSPISGIVFARFLGRWL